MSEGAALATHFEHLINDMMKEVRALPDEGLVWQPPAPETNCAAVIARHALEVARQAIVGMAGGQEIVRDRPAEFAAPVPRAEIEQQAAALLAAARPSLEALKPDDYDVVKSPPAGIPGQPQAVRDHLLHAIEHVGTHLGHLQLTRQLFEKAAQTEGPLL